MSHANDLFPVPEAWAKKAHMDAAGYEAAIAHEASDTDGFWRKVASRLDWITPFTIVKDAVSYTHLTLTTKRIV